MALAERLLARGFELLIHDPQVSVSRLLGANRAYVQERIPHLSQFIADTPEDVVNHAEVCVVGAADPKQLPPSGVSMAASSSTWCVSQARQTTKTTPDTSVSVGKRAPSGSWVTSDNRSSGR